MCALAGCEVAIEQPLRGGRHRLYCSNAHRAEAGRRRLAEAPGAAAADVVDSLLDQLDTVLGGLRRHHGQLRSIDPARQAVEIRLPAAPGWRFSRSRARASRVASAARASGSW